MVVVLLWGKALSLVELLYGTFMLYTNLGKNQKITHLPIYFSEARQQTLIFFLTYSVDLYEIYNLKVLSNS